MENFIGKDGFNWWVGVVESRNDPLKLGRCQVRIFGYHTENKQLIPTADLPWAACLVSPNSTQNFSPPKEGEYVVGFFADGASNQDPVIMGMYTGIKQSAGGDAGFQDPRTPAQIAAAPKPPAGIIVESVGQPTTSPSARGVVANTPQGQAANNRTHICNVAVEINKDVAVVKSEVMGIVKLIRTSLEGLWAGTSSTPIVEEAKEVALALKAKIKLIQKELEPIIDEVRAYQEYIQYLQQLVAYIQSLPAQLQALLAKCLAEATVELKTAQQVVSTLTDQTAVLNELKTEIQAAVDAQEVTASADVTSITVPQLS
jgi:hypothetical protein